MTKFPPRARVEHTVQVVGPDEVRYTGVYWTEGGYLFVRTDDQEVNPRETGAIEIRRTDERCLAMCGLLELHGHPRVTWNDWVPDGCEGAFR